MKLSKTNKKIDNNVCRALTEVCEQSKIDIAGFQWLSHTANYTQFPGSLMVTCVFDCQQSLDRARAEKSEVELQKRVQKQLFKVGIVLKDPRQNLRLDSEEACDLENSGDWATRLQQKATPGYLKNRPASRSRY